MLNIKRKTILDENLLEQAESQKSCMYLYLPGRSPALGNILQIQESDADLSDEDEEYVSAIDYSFLSIEGEELISEDGGIVMIDKYYDEASAEELILSVLEFERMEVPANMVLLKIA